MRSGSPALGKLGTCGLVVVQKGREIMQNPALRKKEVDRRPDVDAWKSGLVYLQTAGAPCGIPRLSNRTLSAKRTWERIFGDWLGGGHSPVHTTVRRHSVSGDLEDDLQGG